ncbi:MAG TPA: sigma-70 factor domain-containing protein, partial [Nocardioides sp.]|nr:sigma-70 factor domain-containing protein [Nocardioides sp.]
MASNARKIPAEVLAHPAVVDLIEKAGPSGSVTPDEVRRASDEAAVEPRHLKALLAHLSSLEISVAVPVSTKASAATASKKATTAKKAPTKKTASKAPAKKAAPAKKSSAKEAPAKKATTAKTTSAKKAAPATKAPGKKSADAAPEVVDPAVPVLGPDGKKILPDLPDEQFEKDVKTDPTIEEDEKKATFVVSAADDTDEPEQQVMVAGATADPVKDYLKQIGKVPLLNAEMEVELAKRIEAGLFSEEKLGKGGKIS